MVKISKTYLPKLTEKYMCEKHKAYFKKKLLDWKSDIIKTNNGYKLLDWRQNFGGELYNGDKYYDLAKLRHNIIFNQVRQIITQI